MLPRFVSVWSDFGKRFGVSNPISIRSPVLEPSKVDLVCGFSSFWEHFWVPFGVSHGRTGLVTSSFRPFFLPAVLDRVQGDESGRIWRASGACRTMF